MHMVEKPSRELPRVQRLHDVPEGERMCPGCHGMREVIGQETSEQYDYSPASIQIIEHVRIKRACRQCAEHVVIASKPATVIEKGLATEGMLAIMLQVNLLITCHSIDWRESSREMVPIFRARRCVTGWLPRPIAYCRSMSG